MNGFRKWALAAYVVLAMYLLAHPSSEQLTERARVLDNNLKNHPTAALSPALAAVLSIPEPAVARHLTAGHTRPSDLVFDKLLDQNGCPRGNANPAEAILEAGVSMKQALRYFDAVEKRVNQQLHPKSAVSASDTKPLLIPRGSSDRLIGKPANG